MSIGRRKGGYASEQIQTLEPKGKGLVELGKATKPNPNLESGKPEVRKRSFEKVLKIFVFVFMLHIENLKTQRKSGTDAIYMLYRTC